MESEQLPNQLPVPQQIVERSQRGREYAFSLGSGCAIGFFLQQHCFKLMCIYAPHIQRQLKTLYMHLTYTII
ncbi:hypothetical protein D3C80_1771130 [compost metagenome]